MFKLVRIDDEGHQEIPLSDGKQVIGRGNFLNCDDKRVSRNHAELEIIDNSIVIKALHINPCFLVNKTMGEAKVILQNTIMKISLGDTIGFLNDRFWYNVCKNNEINDTCLNIKDFQPLKDLINKQKDICTLKYDTTSEESYQKNEKTSTEEQITNITGKEELDDKAPDSRSIITVDLRTQKLEINIESKVQEVSNKDEIKPESDDGLSQSPGKRLIKQESSSPVDIKKLKTEDNAEDRLQSADSQASTSGASSASNASPPKQNLKRERCMYGEKCYRRNPQHKGQFSHPGDADWGAGAKAPCPWGYACARRDPRHWRDHSHPYGMHPPPPPGIQKKKTHIVQKNGKIFYINAHAVNFFDDHFEAEDSDGDSVDYDYEFD